MERLEGLEGLERFKGLGAGKRQAWTPIRSHGCGLGTPVGCEGLAALEEAMDLAVGSLWPALGGKPLDACWLKVARVLTF